MRANLVPGLRLMLVTDDALLAGRDLPALAAAAVQGGVTSVQVRLKRASTRAVAEAVRAVLAAVPAGVPVLVNDRADVALATGAAGVHLCEEDLEVAAVRRLAPADFVIGASVGSPAEAARGTGADYWGVGPFRGTTTKGDAGAAIGAAGVQAVVTLPGAPPCVAIGGVRIEDAATLRATGACGIAVVSGILAAADATAAARAYAAGWGG